MEVANFKRTANRRFLPLSIFLGLGVATLTDARSSRNQPASDLEGGKWQRCASRPAPDAPSARVGHSTVWTGRELLIWGGRSEGTYHNDGARYDPVIDSWHPMSLSNAPSGRWFHAAVWTGSELIIWGGRSAFDNFEVKNDGARYNPVTDVWTPLPQAGAPNARSQMAAVWTGTEMLIWGGAGEGWAIEPAGGRYRPSTQTWAPLSQSGAPESRMGPTAVWTGKELIVWGGVRYAPDQLSFGTGGRYDPVRDGWTLLPTNDAPRARSEHSAVWTGSEMIIWGGGEDNKFMNSGGRFNVATGKWTPTTLRKAPQCRQGHCAVWSGSEMVIWAGATDARNLTFSGARYDPVTDEWNALTNIRAPAARVFQRGEGAVWTEHGMLIFGGSVITKELDTAYLWNPKNRTSTH